MNCNTVTLDVWLLPCILFTVKHNKCCHLFLTTPAVATTLNNSVLKRSMDHTLLCNEQSADVYWMMMQDSHPIIYPRILTKEINI